MSIPHEFRQNTIEYNDDKYDQVLDRLLWLLNIKDGKYYINDMQDTLPATWLIQHKDVIVNNYTSAFSYGSSLLVAPVLAKGEIYPVTEGFFFVLEIADNNARANDLTKYDVIFISAFDARLKLIKSLRRACIVSGTEASVFEIGQALMKCQSDDITLTVLQLSARGN